MPRPSPQPPRGPRWRAAGSSPSGRGWPRLGRRDAGGGRVSRQGGQADDPQRDDPRAHRLTLRTGHGDSCILHPPNHRSRSPSLSQASRMEIAAEVSPLTLLTHGVLEWACPDSFLNDAFDRTCRPRQWDRILTIDAITRLMLLVVADSLRFLAGQNCVPRRDRQPASAACGVAGDLPGVGGGQLAGGGEACVAVQPRGGGVRRVVGLLLGR